MQVRVVEVMQSLVQQRAQEGPVGDHLATLAVRIRA
jgi:hypothetical protein